MSNNKTQIQKRLNKANKDLENAIKANDLKQVVTLQRKVTDLEDEIKAVEYMEKKRGNKMGFRESLNNMFRSIATVKEKQNLNLHTVKKEIEKLDEEILELKKQYSTSLDSSLLDEITNKRIKKGELKAKLDIMDETLQELDRDITLAIDYESEINSIYAPLHEKEAQYKDALKKAKAIESELLEIIKEVNSGMGDIIRNLNYVSDENRQIIQDTQSKNTRQLLYSSLVNSDEIKPDLNNIKYREQYIPHITTQMSIDYDRAKRQKEKQAAMAKLTSQDEELKAMGIEWEAGV